MGEAYDKGVPLLGVPGITLDTSRCQLFLQLYILPKTNQSHLKIDGLEDDPFLLKDNFGLFSGVGLVGFPFGFESCGGAGV